MKDETENSPDCGGHPRAVRWINIAGIDWEVLSSMALRYRKAIAWNIRPKYLLIHQAARYSFPSSRGRPPRSRRHSIQGWLLSRSHVYSRSMSFRPFRGWPQTVWLAESRNSLSVWSPEKAIQGRPRTSSLQGDRSGTLGEWPSTKWLPDSSTWSNASWTIISIPFSCLYGFAYVARLFFKMERFSERFDKPISWISFQNNLSQSTQSRAVKLDFLTAGDRPNIRHDPMCIFLFRDGNILPPSPSHILDLIPFHTDTIISLMPTCNLDFTAPITERLYNNQSILRVSEDASLLMEALLDLG